MPLHKSSRAPRLERTMISAPLDDFRHTMHIGRGGDAFGDTSFLSTHGPESVSSFTLDLDLGPSIMGDVLGVMDGLGLDSNEEDVFSPSNNTSLSEMKSGRGALFTNAVNGRP
uniref:CDC42 effector protein (Rho GTPase binding) 5 n=1 Tax=Gadus morhua TaxID=8049 RepID=A0A8C5A7D4_GADMO